MSYCHSARVFADTDTDPAVKALFNDLVSAVRAIARFPTSDIGFFDGLLPAGSDWKIAVPDALSATEVFVPLYSPGYLTRPWSMGERESFRRRLVAAHPDQARQHVVPVLWTPLPFWDQMPQPDLDVAMELGDGSLAYTENGLRALQKLRPYRTQYKAMVGKLARRIVNVAELSPLEPSRAPVLAATVDEPSGSTPPDKRFIVGVLAPTRGKVPRGRLERTYGTVDRSWRPFPDARDLPIADYAANVAQRLGLPTSTVDFATDRSVFDDHPGMLLIDPWILDRKDGTTALASLGATLPPWVTALLVVDVNDPQYHERGAAACREVEDMLRQDHDAWVQRAKSVEEFERLMPRLVAEARKRYLYPEPVLGPEGSATTRIRSTGTHPAETGEQTDA